MSNKDRNSQVRVTLSVVLVNNNDYDVALLNVEGFSLIDNAGNLFDASPNIAGVYSRVDGIATCFNDTVSNCTTKGNGSGSFVSPDKYTIVSAKTAIPLTYFTAEIFEDEVGGLFTFSTKLMMYKVGTDNEIAQTSKIQAPRLITIGIPNILRR